MKIGCNTVLFASVSLEEALQNIAYSGFEAAEIACIGFARHVWPDFSEEDRAKTREILENSGLDIVAMEAATDLLSDEGREWFIEALQLAKDLGIPLVTSGSGGKSGEEDLAKVEAIFPEIAAKAEELGVKVSIKAHVHQAVYNVESSIRMMKAVNSPWLGVNYDATHLYREDEDIFEAWDALAPYVNHIHFRDLLGGEDKAIGSPLNQVPGLGVLDLPRLLRQIRTSGYDGALDLEVIGAMEYPAVQSMGIGAQARGYIRRCLEEIDG